jgi:hypothetical protein
MRRTLALGALGLWVVAISGCTTYYMVRDPSSGRTYYTTEIKPVGQGGAVKFKDEKTGAAVTIQSSEVKEIGSDEYKAALEKK